MTNVSKSINDMIRETNEILKAGEPGNVSVDTFSKMSGYVPQFIIDAMNKVFGVGNWGFTEISNEFIDKDENGKPTMAIAQVEVWLNGSEFRPRAYGQSRITRGDFGDAKKGAQTDAIKKALSYFSIGNRAFHGLLKGKV